MSETAMRRLRAANPVADLPAPRPIETVMPGWRELDDGDRGSGARERGRLRGLGVVLSMVGVAVTVAVMILFTSLPGHRQTASRPSVLGHPPLSGPGTVPPPLGSVPTLQQLVDNFAVLRGSRGGSPFAPGQKNLTRVARVFPGGDRVYVYVRRFSARGQLNSATDYAVTFGIVDSHGNSSVTDFGGNVSYGVYPISWGGLRGLRTHPDRKRLWVSLVPDGVATVTWRFDCRPAPHVNPRICAGIRTQTVTLPVINNVAAREIAGVGRAGGPTVTWRAPNGRVVGPSFGGYGNFAAPPFVKGEREGRELRVLRPNGIGGARIGEPASNAIQKIERLLGAPARVNVRTGACGIDHETVWASPTAANLLTIFERAGRFVGYRYGAPVDEIGLIQGPGVVLTTANGLALDDTVAAGRRLYAGGFTTSAVNGNTWRADSNGGSVGGSVLPAIYPVRGITPSDRIANIAAGETGCAASAN